MRYFRHAAMTFWLVAAIVAVGVGVFAYTHGNADNFPEPGPSVGLEQAEVKQFRSLLADLVKISHTRGDLDTWSDQARTIATTAHDRARSARGADAPLSVAWAETTGEIDRLAAAEGPGIEAAVDTLVRRGDRLLMLVTNTGVPVSPYLPAGTPSR